VAQDTGTDTVHRKIIIYVPDASVTDESKLQIATVLIALSSGSESDNTHTWKTWLLSFACICFSDLMKRFMDSEDPKMKEFVIREYPASFVRECNSLREPSRYETGEPHTPTLPGLPQDPPFYAEELLDCANVADVYAYFALLCVSRGDFSRNPVTDGPKNLWEVKNG